jgi:hypothetical protein
MKQKDRSKLWEVLNGAGAVCMLVSATRTRAYLPQYRIGFQFHDNTNICDVGLE